MMFDAAVLDVQVTPSGLVIILSDRLPFDADAAHRPKDGDHANPYQRLETAGVLAVQLVPLVEVMTLPSKAVAQNCPNSGDHRTRCH